MAVKLAFLIGWLGEDIKPHNSTPSPGQYRRCVLDAVADYSTRVPIRRVTTLDVVSGMASYDLPMDFLELDFLASPLSAGNVIVGDQGIIPVSSTFEETVTIAGLTLTLYPTPTYTVSREMHYSAGIVLDADEIYQAMTDGIARIVMHKASALALLMKAHDAAQKAWQYQQGDERVNMEKLSETLTKDAEKMEEKYEAAIAKATGAAGTLGTRATYTPEEYGTFAGDVKDMF